MTYSEKCVLCEAEADFEDYPIAFMLKISCGNCSTYTILRNAYDDLKDDQSYRKNERHLISGYFRELSERGLAQEKTFTLEEINRIISLPWVPKSVEDKANKLLSYIDRRSSYFQEPIEINFDTPAIAYCKNPRELACLYHELGKLNLINTNGQAPKGTHAMMARLTLTGAKEVERLKQASPNSKQCFVAMRFDQQMDNIYKNHIDSAVKATGFEPLRINDKEHNGDICDHIIGEIKKSRFLIADFTGLRPGVYYEAGFAHGLGLPVIFTCHEDWFDKEIDRQIKGTFPDGNPCECTEKTLRSVHFDLEHRNFIIWKNGPELQDKLIKRINATIS
ncbi:MAG: hypothetical protein CVV64_16265 [Candidatus Wallbacteria bacterium HGW-Wallbacteria-1]|jgi:virulence-associated protein VapD|uniref:Nucleoside 2-deoxyribosyltransferase n=1 Tax=Candidatus Wallbacteria bacterium HGW-Wallbacteria-1 TaxID=2013854 RepID=A0A2N1PL39_9BACT|nr:MAG: hypothetical protein CVV64_16265 [Candidatus Wallbacteria bacterium HGW-Wallbacteria-1]